MNIYIVMVSDWKDGRIIYDWSDAYTSYHLALHAKARLIEKVPAYASKPYDVLIEQFVVKE